jgi:ribosome-associated heat shock protein Hsp15
VSARGDGDPDQVRLDKWLWAARFFKTRPLAVAAIEGGKVQVEGQRAKPGRNVRAGSRIAIRKEGLEWDVEVLGVSRQRGPAPQAALLYREEEASRLHRERLLGERREAGAAAGRPGERPTKRDRRQIERFIGGPAD